MSIITGDYKSVLSFVSAPLPIVEAFSDLENFLSCKFSREYVQEIFYAAMITRLNRSFSSGVKSLDCLSDLGVQLPFILSYPMLLSDLKAEIRNALGFLSFTVMDGLNAVLGHCVQTNEKHFLPVECGGDFFVSYWVVVFAREQVQKAAALLKPSRKIKKNKKKGKNLIRIPQRTEKVLKFFAEKQVADRLSLKLQGQREVSTSFGRIDVLADDQLIEVKHYRSWKGAVGQVLAYSVDYPKHQKRIHLYGHPVDYDVSSVFDFCILLGIVVTLDSD